MADEAPPSLSPLARWMLIGLTVFFFAASLGQLAYLHDRIEYSGQAGFGARLAALVEASPSADRVALLDLQARVALEEHALARRYHQANVLLMSRVWITYLSFVIGMILCLVGASFVLARVRGPDTELSVEGAGATGSIKSASPGLVLATLGAMLIAIAILSNHRIGVEDAAIYLSPGTASATSEAVAVPADTEESVDPDDPAHQDLFAE